MGRGSAGDNDAGTVANYNEEGDDNDKTVEAFVSAKYFQCSAKLLAWEKTTSVVLRLEPESKNSSNFVLRVVGPGDYAGTKIWNQLPVTYSLQILDNRTFEDSFELHHETLQRPLFLRCVKKELFKAVFDGFLNAQQADAASMAEKALVQLRAYMTPEQQIRCYTQRKTILAAALEEHDAKFGNLEYGDTAGASLDIDREVIQTLKQRGRTRKQTMKQIDGCELFLATAEDEKRKNAIHQTAKEREQQAQVDYDNNTMRRQAMTQLMTIALQPEYAEQIVLQEGLVDLVTCLDLDDISNRTLAAGALGNVSMHDLVDIVPRDFQPRDSPNVDKEFSIVEEITSVGVLEPLVRLMYEDNDAAQSESTRCLQNLATTDKNRVAVVSSKAVDPLISLLSSRDEEVKTGAAGVLANLAMIEINIDMIMQSGVTGPLVNLLRNGKELPTVIEVVRCLGNLCSSDAHRGSIMDALIQIQAFPYLLRLADSDQPEAEQVAAGCLAQLALAEDNRERMVKHDVVPVLVEKLCWSQAAPGQAPITMTHATACLCSLALAHENKVPLMQRGAINPLLAACMSEQNPSILRNAVGAIRNLATHDENKVSIVDNDAVPVLVEKLTHPDALIKLSACGALAELATSPSPVVADNNKDVIRDEGAVQKIANLCRDNDVPLRLMASKALRLLDAPEVDLMTQSAVRIQAFYRGKMARRMTDQLREDADRQKRETLRHASKIQSVWVGYKDRQMVKKVKMQRQKERACLKLQSVYKGHRGRNLARAKRRHFFEMESMKAVAIQSTFRGFQGRCLADKRRLQLMHIQKATVIESAFRGFKGRVEARRRKQAVEDFREECATRIQSGFRGMKGRAHFQTKVESRKQQAAATLVQTRFRGHKSRKHAQVARHDQFRLETKQAIKIQAGFRGFRGRKRARGAAGSANEKDAVRTIQRVYRGHLGRREFDRRTRVKMYHSAAIRLQAFWRLYQNKVGAMRQRIQQRREKRYQKQGLIFGGKHKPSSLAQPPSKARAGVAAPRGGARSPGMGSPGAGGGGAFADNQLPQSPTSLNQLSTSNDPRTGLHAKTEELIKDNETNLENETARMDAQFFQKLNQVRGIPDENTRDMLVNTLVQEELRRRNTEAKRMMQDAVHDVEKEAMASIEAVPAALANGAQSARAGMPNKHAPRSGTQEMDSMLAASTGGGNGGTMIMAERRRVQPVWCTFKAKGSFQDTFSAVGDTTAGDAATDANSRLDSLEAYLRMKLRIFGSAHPEVLKAVDHLIMWCNNTGVELVMTGDHLSGLTVLKKSEQLLSEFQVSNRVELKAMTNDNIALYYLKRNKTHAAAQYTQKTAKMLKGLGGSSAAGGQASSYVQALSDAHCGAVMFRSANYDEALQLSQKAFFRLMPTPGALQAADGGDVFDDDERCAAALALHNMASAHLAMGNNSEGLDCVRKASQVARQKPQCFSSSEARQMDSTLREAMRVNNLLVEDTFEPGSGSGEAAQPLARGHNGGYRGSTPTLPNINKSQNLQAQAGKNKRWGKNSLTSRYGVDGGQALKGSDKNYTSVRTQRMRTKQPAM